MSAREVFLVGGSPWGFRMHGGHDLRQPLRISRVNPGSKAAQQGMREGDLISSINGKSAGELTNSEAHALLRNAGDTLKLGLNLENTGSPKRHRAHRSSVRESATTEIVRETTTTTTTTAAKTTTTSSTRRVTTESKKTGEANEAKVGQSSIDCRNGGLSARLEVKQRNPAKKSKTRNTLHPVDSQGLCDRSSKLDRKGKEIRMSRGIRKQGKRRGHGRRNARRCPTLVTAVEGMEKPSDSSSKDVEGVAGSQECSKRERCSIERGTTARPVVKVVEISTISSLPLEATVDHIPGVGIVESGAGGSSSEDAIVTISEPTESLRPFTTTSNDGERLEILDVSDHCHSEVTEVETVNANPVVDEADSDTATGETSSDLVPRRPTWNLRNSTSEWDSVMPRDVEAELRSFIEGLKLPSHVHDAEEALRRRACKRTRKMHQVALLHSQQSDRFLDSIQEENERISEEKQQQQQVRDFINEEISKFRRKEDVGQLERDLFYCPPAPPNRSSSLPDVPPFQETHSDDPAAPRRPSLPNCQHPLDTRDPKSGVLGNLLTMMGLSSIANSQLLVCFPGTLLGEHRHLPERERGILDEKADAREPTNRLLAIIKENSKKRSRKPTTTTLGVDRERLKVTRLCDWLTSARYEQLVGESCAILENGTVERILPLRRIKDSRYSVNPALIDGKVEERKKTAASSLVAKCVASVDKSCIDTTSIFDQSPPRSHLEPRRHVNGEVETKAKMSAIPVNGEVFRQLMYNEYVDKVLEREKRKQLKTLRLSSPESALKANNWPEKRSACSVEGEFMEKARTRLNRIGIKLDDEEVGKETRLTEKMPKHLQEFLGVSGDDENVMFAPTFKASSAAAGIWSPNTDPPIVEKERSPDRRTESQKDVEIPAIWTPPSVAASPVSGRKEFRPVPFESPTLSRKKPAATRQQESEGSIKESAAVAVVELTQPPPPPPPWMTEGKKRETSTQDSSGSSLTSRLPRVQNPTITLLQKAREGQLPKGASYLAEREQEEEVSAAKGCLRDGGRPVISPADIIYTVKKEYESEPETENESPRKMVDLGPRKFEGIGPTSKEGIPLVLRSEVKETNQTKWYKKMYDSLHRADRSDDYVTVRYKPTRANRHGYGSGSSSGYLSEPDYRLYSSDLLRSSSTLDNRHCTRNKRNEFSASSTVPRRSGLLRYSPEVYKNQPGRIEDYEPGRSSITEKEAKEWWDEVMDIFDGPFDQRHVSHRPTKPYMAHALKESGYESDSTLVFKRKEDISPLNEFEQRLAYKSVQSGGDVPLHGLRKPAPERPKDNADVKYFQVSPTLMRIHVHRKTVPVVSSSTRKQGVATTTKIRETRVVRTRTSPKTNASKKDSTVKPPPSPPERLSSRNSKTLDMYASRGKRVPGKAKSSKESTVSCDCRSLSCPKRANVRGRLTRKEQEESSRRLTKSSVGRKTGASTLGEAKPTSRKPERGQQRSRTVVGASTSKPKDVSIKSNDVKRQKGKVSNGGSGREKTKKAEETRQLSPASLTNVARTENVSRIVRSTRSEASLKSLIVYLAQKRPVSNSIFRSWERKRSLSEPSRTSSLRSLQVRSGREEYRRYVLEMLHEGRKSGRGSERYKQLFDYYSSLERLGELERTFSTGDLRTIGGSRNKRTVDYDRWKATRSREKAESEYSALHVKLSAAQKERNFLFSAKQTSKFKWQESRELRCKDRSVDDIVQRFNKLQSEDGGGLVTGKKWQTPRDTYKPLWRGRSVLNVANALQRKAAEEKESKLSLRQNLGGSKMFWSSLSSEQVATLKRQLNEIYGSDNLQRLQAAQKPRNLAKFEIVVPTEAKSLDDVRGNARKLLHVRCHSMSASEVPPSPMIEMDRKKLSVSLGREAMERVSQRANLFLNRETEDAMKMDSGADVASKIEFFEGAIPKGRNVDGLSGTQSFADLRELFGERESAKYATPFLLEKVRTRSPSPARHWRSTCLRPVKNGAVKRLSARFESMEELSMHERRAKPMRFRSDPELARERQRTPILCEILSSDSRRSRRSSCRDNGRSLSSPADLAGTRRRIGDRVDKVVTESANVTSSPPPPPKYERHAHDCHPESPRRYVEGEVTIHYRSPVRTEAKEVLSEEELARRSAENMRRVYQEERRRKYMQELHDIDSRRHTDNFTPSQKSPIPLNRYDDVVNELHPIHGTRSADQTPEPRLVARALYNFTSQSPRELNFRRGDVIFIRRRVDKNWYEGEHNAMIGLFPSNYVEILPYESARTAPKKPYEGQARAKFNFVAQTKLELSLAKGELVILTRRVDENWYEGRIGNRKGIFPVSYVEAITEPGHGHLLTNGSTGGGKTSTAPHRYPLPINANQSGQRQHYNSLPRMGSNRLQASHLDQALHINTHLEPVAYRALYRYRPQNEDELELDEGDTVYVMEKCDDGWYVGSSQRTGCFGTFPGNYVEQL